MLELDVPAARGPQAYTQIVDGTTYFHAEVPVVARKAPRALPGSVMLVWDSSGSGRSRDHAREFALLDAYFTKVRHADVRLLRVRDAAEPAQPFKVERGDWRALRRALEATVYDGATDLGAVALDPAAQEVLLFSDGISNFGAQRLPGFTVPVYAISAAARADSALLRHVAEAPGGRFVDLYSASAGDAADALLTESSRIVAIDADRRDATRCRLALSQGGTARDCRRAARAIRDAARDGRPSRRPYAGHRRSGRGPAQPKRAGGGDVGALPHCRDSKASTTSIAPKSAAWARRSGSSRGKRR